MVDEILGKLEAADARIKLRKIRLCQTLVTFLGEEVSRDGWRIGQKFLQAMEEVQIPDTIKELRSFLGLASWQRSFIKSYSELVEPLQQLTKKGTVLKEVWKEEHSKAFEQLKTQFTEAPLIHHPDYGRRFYLYTDASDIGVGGMLTQKSNIGEDLLLGYFSKKLKPHQINY